MTRDEIVRTIAERIAALAARFPQLRDFDAATRFLDSRIGDLYVESSLDGPRTASFAELSDAIAQIITDVCATQRR